MHNNKYQKGSLFNLRHDVLVCLLLVIATLAVYWQVQHHDFVNFDDNDYVYENRHVQNGLTLEGIAWAFTAFHAGNWHPATWLSHMLDCQLFGLNPGRHHLSNLFLHIANTFLLFFVFRKMTGCLWRSAFVAALFALHPCHVGSVAWISERKDVLSTFFWLLTMWGYIRYVEQPKVNRYLWVALFFMLGLMSKPMLVTLPFVLLLIDYWPLCRFRFEPLNRKGISHQKTMPLRLVWEKIPLLALVVMSSALTFYAQKHGGLVVSFDTIPFKARVANALVSYVKYIGKMIYPAKLAAIYPHPGMLPWWQIIGACLLLVTVSFVAARFVKQRPYLAVGWLWYIGTLVPVIGLVQVGNQSMADRYTYVPFIGLFIIVAWGVPELTARWKHSKKGLAALAAVALAAFMAVTWKQVGYWQNSITLFEHNLKVAADHFVPHNMLGVALEKKGRTEEAIEHYLRALKIYPDYEKAHYNIGNALDKLGRTEEAVEHFVQTLQIRPDYEEAHNNLGNALEKQGRIEEAIEHYVKALQINPDYAKAHNNLGNVLEKQGRTKEAIEHYVKALQINPDYAKAHNNLGNILTRIGRTDEAIKHYSEALRINPTYAEAHNNLGIVLAESGKSTEAVDHYLEALRLNPSHLEAYMNLGAEMSNQGRIDEAFKYFQKALSLQPKFSEAMYQLAKLHISRNEYEKALALYQKMLSLLPDNPALYYNVACIYAKQHKPEQSISWLQKAVAKGFDDWNHIKTDRDLDNIRGSSQYKAFVEGH